MINEIQSLVDEYTHWLKEKTQLRQVNEWVEITTPYLDRHNDYLQIYARRRNGDYVLTDAGYILQDLELSGCKLDSPKRRALLMMTLNGFGVKLNRDRLEVYTSATSFAPSKHNLIQAMLAVNDLFGLATPMTASLFYEDVIAWLEANDIRYTSECQIHWPERVRSTLRFHHPKIRDQPERILKTISSPNRNTAQAVAFAGLI